MINSIDIKIDTIGVKSQTRQLRSEWTREMVYDLNKFSGITEELEKEILIAIRREKRLNSIKNIFSNQKPQSDFHI